ncbi:CNNM domain-containing protein [Gammaproteobacteria bacterium AS21]
MSLDILLWIGIIICISQSAIFSGLNIALFSLSRLQLEVESTKGNAAAVKVLALRSDSNFLLATILWGNVGINVLLTLLSDSALAGISSFLFSTVAITVIGEITPQAYFSRNALKMGSMLTPVIRFYQILFYPVAKPSAIILDTWLGKEGITYLAESELSSIIRKHIEAEETDINHVEGIGALNFFKLDKISVSQEGEFIDPDSIITLPTKMDLPIIPQIINPQESEFLKQLNRSGHRWVVLTNEQQEPLLVVDADGLLRSVFFETENFDPYLFCHRPTIITDENTMLNNAIIRMKASESIDKSFDGAIERDVLLIWGDNKRIITGADIFGLLLKGMQPGN